MSLDISLETEARIKDEASRQGVSVNALLERLIEERGTGSGGTARPSRLPVWNLGGAGALHRRDIYDDVA
jgi:hypothetical protein